MSKTITHDDIPIQDNAIHKAWEDVIIKDLPVKDSVRQEIYKSWIKSKKMGLDPYSNEPPMTLSGRKLNRLFKTNNTLIEIAKPVMEMIHILVGDTGFLVTLSEKSGYVLVVLGDSDILEMAKRNFYLVGCRRDIDHAGTNAIGLCLELDEPIQLTGCEHYRVKHHDWTCSSAPIRDAKCDTIGAFTLSGTSGSQHKHTLALVTTAAETIEGNLQTCELNNEVRRLNSILSSIFDSTAEGVIALDPDQRITNINRRALQMLKLKKSLVTGKDFAKVTKPDDLLLGALNTNSALEGTEINFICPGGDQSYICKIDPIREFGGKGIGKLITLAGKQQVLNMTKSIGGNYARYHFESIKGNSEVLKKQIALAKITAKTNSRVLITGESGTGKELFAQAIHNYSNRNTGPFVAISCATIPRDLVESELFGYRPGAFTGARSEGKVGKFEIANNGTLFLDEINSLPLDIQAKLLRVLQQNEISRLGDSRTITVDVRVISATNTNLFSEVESNNFREDLYYRLNVVEISIPPLRDREGDIPILIEHFTEHLSTVMKIPRPKITKEIFDILNAYSWHGNVRELENCIERVVILAQGGTVLKQHLPHRVISKPSTFYLNTTSLQDGYKELIEATLERCNGNASKAAKKLQIARSTLYRKMKAFNIPRK
ncbi:MAG: sigma-54-dependent Fis family transcriptional regulator [Nitrospinales bacterium]